MRSEERLATLSQIARRVSTSLDLRQTLDTIVTAAAKLVPSMLAEISLWDEEQSMLTLQALHCEPNRAIPIGTTYPPGEGYTGWVVRNKHPLLVTDVDARQDIQPDLLPGELPFKAYLGLPLLVGEELVGTLVLVHDQKGAFGQDDLMLLEALAEQTASAIRNARLYHELNRRHQEIAALYTISEAANRLLNLDKLLDQALDHVIQVTRAQGGGIRLLDPLTQEAVLAAHQGLSDSYVQEAARFPLSREIVGWVACSKRPTLSDDMWADTRVSQEVRKLLKREGHRSLAQIPLCTQDQLVGTLGVVSRSPGFFKQGDLRLLNAIGHQLGTAIANAQLFKDTQLQARHLAVLNAVAAVINQPLPLQEIMDMAVAKVVAVMEATAGGIRFMDQTTKELVVASSSGMSPEKLKEIERFPLGEGAEERLAQLREPLVIKGFDHDPRFADHTFAIVPLRNKEVTVGILGVSNHGEREFLPEELDLLMAIAHQLSMAIENAQLAREAVETERLAAVGRVASTVAHELRSPLGSIIRSAEFLARPELSADTRQRLTQSIVAMARRLVNTSREILDYTRGSRMVLNRSHCGLHEFLDRVFRELRADLSDRGIEVIIECEYNDPVLMDRDRMGQVVYNIVANARDAMPDGGCLTVTTAQLDMWVEMRFTDTGSGVPTELRSRIFEPFVSYGKREGAGLGLSIARRIVREHGGDILIESPPEGGASFVVQLPA